MNRDRRMSNYEKLREKLNELLPDRTELRFGCELDMELREFKGKAVVVRHLPEKNEVTLDVGDDFFHNEEWGGPALKVHKILGQPVTIVDVLRGLVPKTYAINAIGLLVKERENTTEGLGIVFDLGQPLSAPENDEACRAVLELLTDNE